MHGLIFGIRILLHMCVLVGVNFEDEILLRGKNVKPGKISNFQEKNDKRIIIIIIAIMV